jgi:hypothetical protein
VSEPFVVAASIVASFGVAVGLGLIGAPWSWAIAIALLGGVAAGAFIRQARQIDAARDQLGDLAAVLGESLERGSSEHRASMKELSVEIRRLRERLRAAERVADESWVRLQRYDLLQRPGGFEIELYCGVCKAWRPSGVISTWAHFERDDPFVTGEGRFILSCGHEVRADNYSARPGAKVAPVADRRSRSAAVLPSERSMPPAVIARRGPGSPPKRRRRLS